MQTLIFLPFFVQMIVIGLDEYVFHLRRGLPRWERIGHPIDTLSVLACLLFVLFVPYSPDRIKIYVLGAIFSCLLVTKDEFIHKHVSPPAEQWLHAILFLNHPVVLTFLGLMWPKLHGGLEPNWIPAQHLHPFLWIQSGMVFLFFLYQVIYWNFLWRPLITDSTTN